MRNDKLRQRASFSGLGWICIASLLWVGSPRTARADGAFPDSDQILLPQSQPHRVILGTNFGLLISEDDGATWSWVCEQLIALCTTLYQLNSTEDHIFAVSSNGFAILPQDACGVSFGTGPFLNGGLSDGFADPADPTHVLVIGAAQSDAASQPSGIYSSKDTGQTFGAPIIQAPTSSFFGGVEIARSDPKTIYATQCVYDQMGSPSILRSSDGGGTFSTFDQSATLGNECLHIAQVDPTNAMRIFFRATADDVDSLVISEDGGMTSRTALSFPADYHMTAFLLRADGTMLVTGMQQNMMGSMGACGSPNYTGSVPSQAFVSTDGGHTFTPWANAPHVRALAERNGVLYVAANNFDDGWAMATTTDQGAHFTPILHFNQIGGPLSCPTVQTTCSTPWSNLESIFGIGADMATVVTPPHGGCSCSLTRSPVGSLWLAALLPIAMLVIFRRRIARRR